MDSASTDLVLWTNNACSKSRTAESVLAEAGIPYTRRLYLEDPPTRGSRTGWPWSSVEPASGSRRRNGRSGRLGTPV